MENLYIFKNINIDYNYIGILFIVFFNSIRDKVFYSRSMGWVAVWNIVETLPHELSHWIVAFFTGGKPVGFSIIPKKYTYYDDKDREMIYWAFGEVVISRPRNYNVFLIGLSPLMLIYLSYLVYKGFFVYIEPSLLSVLIFYFILYSLVRSGIPSTQDIKVAFSQLSWLITPALLFCTYYAFIEFDKLLNENMGYSSREWVLFFIRSMF